MNVRVYECACGERRYDTIRHDHMVLYPRILEAKTSSSTNRVETKRLASTSEIETSTHLR